MMNEFKEESRQLDEFIMRCPQKYEKNKYIEIFDNTPLSILHNVINFQDIKFRHGNPIYDIPGFKKPSYFEFNCIHFYSTTKYGETYLISKELHDFDFKLDKRIDVNSIYNTTCNEVEIEDVAVVTQGNFVGAYGHYLFETFSKVKLVEFLGVKNILYVPNHRFNIDTQILEQTNLKSKYNFIRAENNTKYICKNVKLIDSAVMCCGFPVKWIFDFYKEILVKNPKKVFRRLYLCRQNFGSNGDMSRNIVNHDEFLTLLSEYGFETVFMHEHTIKEQARMMSEAEYAIGYHGTAMCNVCFSDERMHLIEITNHRFATFNMNPWRYQFVNSAPYSLFVEDELDDVSLDIRIDIDEMRNHLRNVIK